MTRTLSQRPGEWGAVAAASLAGSSKSCTVFDEAVDFHVVYQFWLFWVVTRGLGSSPTIPRRCLVW